MRRMLVGLALVLALLVLADRLAVVVAEHEVARRIQQEQSLVQTPDVSIGGFPFLTQAVAGRYDDVTLTLTDLRRGPVPVARLTARLSGVRVPLGEVLRRQVGQVPVDRASAQVLVTYAALDRWLRDRHLRLSRAPGGAVRLTLTAPVAGRPAGTSVVGRLSTSGDVVRVTTGSGLDVEIPLPGLPFRARLTRARSTGEGIVVDATAAGLLLHAGGS